MAAVALQARVSNATVSRVINNQGYVKEETRERVLEAMRNISYAKPRRNLIGLIIPDSPNPFFSQLSFTFERALEVEKPRKYLLTLCSEGRADREMELIEWFKQFGIEGLIYISAGKSSETLLRLEADMRIPTVAFDRRVFPGKLDYVAVNSRQGTLAAVDHLVAHGHKRIAYLKGKKDTETAKERFESFCDAMKRTHLDIHKDWIFDGDYTFVSGRRCAELLIKLSVNEAASPTALIAANDVMAIAAMQRLQQQGWVLPTMLSVIGFDDIEWSRWCFPALTTIRQPITQLVLETLRLLNKRIKELAEDAEPRSQPSHFEIEPILVPRDSVTKPFDRHAVQKPRVLADVGISYAK